MFPAQALAEVMLARGWRVKLTTDARGARFTGGFPHTVEIQQISSATFARGGIAAKLLVPFRIIGGVAGAVMGLMRDKPCRYRRLWRVPFHSSPDSGMGVAAAAHDTRTKRRSGPGECVLCQAR